MRPLLLTTVGGAVCAAALISPLLGTAIVGAPVSLLTTALVIVAGVALVWLGSRATTPILRGAFAG